MLVEAILLAIIALLIVWIYFSGGGTLRTRKLTKEINRLKEKNQTLEETNFALRSSLGSSSEKVSQSAVKAEQLIEKLMLVKDALRGSTPAKKAIEKEFDDEIGPHLIREILSVEQKVSSPLKQRIASGVLVGKIGKDILEALKNGKTVRDAAVDAGVPLRTGKEQIRILKKTGYLDNKLNLTQLGTEALEL